MREAHYTDLPYPVMMRAVAFTRINFFIRIGIFVLISNISISKRLKKWHTDVR